MTALLPQKQVAEILSVSERTLERWRVEGRPAFAKAVRKVLYWPDDVEDWLIASRRQSPSWVAPALSGASQ